MRALAALSARAPRGFGVRFATPLDLELPAAARVVIVDQNDQLELVARFPGREVIAQVTSLDEARAALAAGACGLIAKGCEAAGRVGEETTFVLVQHLVGALHGPEVGTERTGSARLRAVPVWAQGGVGLYTAAACIAGGATGIVLDSQLALLRESSLPLDVRAAIAAMDGSETAVIAGHRVFTRPDLKLGEFDPSRLGGDSLATHFVPVGQDAAFAKSLAQRFPTAGQLVRGLHAAIVHHLALAAERAPLAPGAPLAAMHGTRYPIAQGPMSRVTDRARFAAAVADGGGLPFLALTLMAGPEVRDLLRETRRPCSAIGRGASASSGSCRTEVREEQLAVLRELPPPVALIAGGRPIAGARRSRRRASQTYLHVPSPGLLDLFLKDGARKFVFEGRECGGHVGPRSSFALWEAQIERLLAHDKPAELARAVRRRHPRRAVGRDGRRDGRTARRTRREGRRADGHRVPVHRGSGGRRRDPARVPAARRSRARARCCSRPRPATRRRCADTAFAEAFAAEKHRLEAAGMPAQEMWAQLEQLNLGRLRIAAKGLERRGDQIVEVDDAAQQREGMYMIGQVAALRRDVCTIAELHRDVSEGGTALVAPAALREDRDDETAAAPTSR